MKENTTFFAPMIYLKKVAPAIEFYKNAFDAIVLRQWDNDDLFVEDPHAVMAKAVAAGGTEIDPVKDYDYDYRQGCLGDPFGHHWLIEKKIG